MGTFIAFAVAAALASQAPPAVESPDEWLATNAIRLRTLEPDGGGNADLEPLKGLIGDARVVLLGEQAHAEGATFLGKTRLIQFLHREMGFDVLCFESGLYDCERAWQSLRAGTDAVEAMSEGIFPIWMRSAELAPLAAYLAVAARSDRPLELCGYDCQLTGSASREHLLADLKALNAKGAPPPLAGEPLASLDAYFSALLSGTAPTGDLRAQGDAALAALRDSLSPERFPDVGERDRSFWRQMLKSLPVFTALVADMRRDDLPLAQRFNPRDEQGGDTMVWLARERYPNRKIVVWAASMHCVRSPDRIDTQSSEFNYAGVRTMGHVAAEGLGPDVFVLAFTSGAGRAGNVFGRAWEVPEPPHGSLEARLRDATLGACIVPLRGAADGTFGASAFVARPLGNAPMRATWRDHVDALVYTPTMVPATRRGESLATLLDREASRLAERCAKGEPFADKGDMNETWDGWIRESRPGAAAIAAARAALDPWAERHRDDPCLGWRAFALAAHAAAADGQRDKACQDLDAALAAYPKRAHDDPIRQSSFHHLANARGLLELERTDVQDALTWLATLIENDERMRFFYAPPWVERLGEDRLSVERLRAAVRDAFVRRCDRFPADEAAIRSAAEAADRTFEAK